MTYVPFASRLRPFVLCLVLALSGTAVADAQNPAAQAFVEQRHQQASTLLRRPAGDARNRELQRVFADMLDYQEVARRSLGRHWNEHTEAERAQFTRLLQHLVERAYQDNLQRTLSFEVRIVGSESQAGTTLVRTEARSRSNRRAPPVQIDYSLRAAGNTFKVVDIHTDGVSLVANYRSQFNRIITREGWAGLIRRMETRVQGGGTNL